MNRTDRTPPSCHAVHDTSFLDRSYTDVLRGVCMLLIVFSHTANEFTSLLESWHLDAVLLGGRYATGVFFFLSGYGLTLSMHRNTVGLAYIFRHLRRLLVPYFVFWVFYVAAGLLCGGLTDAGGLAVEFLSLKMPGADTWFFRTILAVYVVYFFLAFCVKRHSAAVAAVLVAAYVVAGVWLELAPWLWNTILCFPLGILFSRCPRLRRSVPAASLLLLPVLFVVFYKFVSISCVSAIVPSVVLCLLCAYASPFFRLRGRFRLLAFIGVNSLHMYFMEAIPLNFFDSGEVGFFVFVVGGTALSVLLTYAGSVVESRLLSGRR